MHNVSIIPVVVVADDIVVAEFVICSIVVVADSIVLWHLRCPRPVSTETAYFGGWKEFLYFMTPNFLSQLLSYILRLICEYIW